MKKIFQLLILTCTVVILTGCVKAEYHLTLNKDGTASLATTLGISNDMYGMVATSGDPFEDSKKELEAEGYLVTEYKGESHTGITATKVFDTLEDIKISTGDAGEESTGDIPFTVEKEEGPLSTLYKVKGVLDLTEETTSETEEETSLDEGLDGLSNSILSQADITFKLTTPTKLTNSNATSTDEVSNTSTWKLTPGEKNEISFETSVLNAFDWIIVIGTSLVIVLALILLIVVLVRRKRT